MRNAITPALEKCVLGHVSVIYDCDIEDGVDAASKSLQRGEKATDSWNENATKRLYFLFFAPFFGLFKLAWRKPSSLRKQAKP
jgi:hypothetical protein